MMPSQGLSAKVRELNLAPIAFKVALDERWPLDKVREAEFLYRCFWQAKLDNPAVSLAPSRMVDQFWHHHILDTSKYINDCNSVFGSYLHHFPYSGARGELDAQEQEMRFEVSQELVNSIAEGENHATYDR